MTSLSQKLAGSFANALNQVEYKNLLERLSGARMGSWIMVLMVLWRESNKRLFNDLAIHTLSIAKEAIRILLSEA